jgi:hypothetical protein
LIIFLFCKSFLIGKLIITFLKMFCAVLQDGKNFAPFIRDPLGKIRVCCRMAHRWSARDPMEVSGSAPIPRWRSLREAEVLVNDSSLLRELP